jgi:hypothetical protein
MAAIIPPRWLVLAGKSKQPFTRFTSLKNARIFGPPNAFSRQASLNWNQGLQPHAHRRCAPRLTLMETSAELALARYTEIYEKLYAHAPKDVRILSGDWLIVNGAQLRASELAQMTDLLELEHSLTQERKRSLATRLTSWLRQ